MLLENIKSNITRHCLIVMRLMFIRVISHRKYSHYIFNCIACCNKSDCFSRIMQAWRGRFSYWQPARYALHIQQRHGRPLSEEHETVSLLFPGGRKYLSDVMRWHPMPRVVSVVNRWIKHASGPSDKCFPRFFSFLIPPYLAKNLNTCLQFFLTLFWQNIFAKEVWMNVKSVMI